MKERLQSGKMTVNYDNIDFLEIKRVGTNFEVYILHRPKIKIEKVKLLREFLDVTSMNTYFVKLKFFRFGKFWVNTKNFLAVEECEKDNDKVKIKCFMKNMLIEESILITEWETIKNSKLL